MATRKKYTKEFKVDAVSLVLEQGYSRIEAARSLEINIQMLGRWIKEYHSEGDGQAFRGNGKLTLEQEEIRKLKAQVKRNRSFPGVIPTPQLTRYAVPSISQETHHEFRSAHQAFFAS